MTLIGRCLLVMLAIGALACGAGAAGDADFTAVDGVWLYDGSPYYSTSAHAIFHKFRTDRVGAVDDLKRLRQAGFTTVEVYWQWGKDLDPATDTYSFDVFDDFVLACKQIGLETFCMFQEYTPGWLADKYGWDHTSEEGKRDVRVDDFYVCDPTFVAESKRFYTTLIEHLKQRPDVSENVLYWNMGGEYKPFRPHRQPKPLDYGYDLPTVAAFREWLKAKSWSLADVAGRWGAAGYASWGDVWPAINMSDTDYKGRALSKIGCARWDWYDFRQEVSWKHMADAIRWVREAGDARPMVHEYNIITPGGMAPMLRWSRVGARPGSDGIHQASGTFDREFDYASLISNLAICRGASDPPWQSNEQKGDTSPEWMTKHAWLLIAMGGTGMHFWDWRGDGWGVMKPDGSPGQGYAAAVRLNAEFEFLGDLLQGSRPMANRIGILALSEESFYSPGAHSREMTLILNTLLENGSGCEAAIITDDEVLHTDISGYRMIVVPGQEHMRSGVREKLAEFAREGGALWLTPGSASKDETDQPTESSPGAPLDAAAGLRITGAKDEPVIGDLDSSEQAKPYGMLGVNVTATSAEPVARLSDTGEPVVYRNRFGKGVCYFQAGGTAYPPDGDTPLVRDPDALSYYIKSNAGQLPVGLLEAALAERGIAPYARVFAAGCDGEPLSAVMVGVRKADPGYLVFLVEGSNRFTDVRVQLNLRRLGIDGKWTAYVPETLERRAVDERGSFVTYLKPSQVKVFHVLPEGRYAEWASQFRGKEWGAIETWLPPTPRKRLVPPSEVGRVDPGDLANVKSKPYGDRWLLVDISRHANRSLVDEGKQENAKAFLGSTGVGDNDLGELPTGLRKLAGAPFDILDPAVSGGTCMITKTVGRPWLGPLEFTGIPVREKVRRIHWLYGTGWAPFDLPVGYITYHYSDGTKDEENLVCGKNIMNWWGRAQEYENDKLQLAWSGNTPAAKRNFTTVGLYHYAWENPHPEKTVESIDVTSYGGDACIIVVAITGER